MQSMQKQLLNELGITQWALRRDDFSKDVVQSNPALDLEASMATDALEKAKPDIQVDFLVVTTEANKPEWWKTFLGLLPASCQIADSTSNYQYKYCLHFDVNQQYIVQQQNYIKAPSLSSFDESLKRQLWNLLKPWLTPS